MTRLAWSNFTGTTMHHAKDGDAIVAVAVEPIPGGTASWCMLRGHARQHSAPTLAAAMERAERAYAIARMGERLAV